MEKIDFENVVLSRKIWVITILSSMGVFMDGYALSIFSSAYIYLKYSFLSVSIITSIAASSIYIGMFVGSIILGRLSDLLGRKRIYVYDLLITAVFLILTGLSHNFIEFVAFQILAGLGIGADYPISSSSNMEIGFNFLYTGLRKSPSEKPPMNTLKSVFLENILLGFTFAPFGESNMLS